MSADAALRSDSGEPPSGEPLVELRVLAGRTEGAVAAVERGRWIGVGHAFTNDVVLRDPGARGVRLRLRAGEGSAELDVMEGSVELLGQVATGPAAVILPAYVPLFLGESAIALGDPESPRWAEARRLLQASRPAPDGDGDGGAGPVAEPASGRALPPWRVISPAASALPRLAPVLPVAGGALAAVVLALLGWAAVSHFLGAAPSPAQASAALQADGFHALDVGSDDSGLVIKGVLPHERDLARLREDVARRGWPAAVAVRTNDALVQNVADVLRTNGVDADVRAIGAGVLAASVRGGDPGRIELLRRRALHDVPGLRQLVVNGGAGDSSLLGGDPNKRVVSVVGGDEGFVQTSDGARYFVGAVLPSGHTITSIEGQTVRVEKAGRTTELRF